MGVIYGILWFIVVTTALVFALPRILDAFLYYFDKRSAIYMKETDLMIRRNEIIKEQIKLQQYSEQRAMPQNRGKVQ